jgi:heptosyltransferase-3
VIRGGALGDFILTLPAIKGLRDAYPAAQIDILGYRHIAALAENRFYSERVRSIESAELSRFFAKAADLPASLEGYFASFDLIISYLYDPDSIFENNLQRCGAKRIIRGPARIDRQSHATRQLARPIEEVGVRISDFAPKLFLSDEDRHRAAGFLAGLSAPIVAFHPGSGSDKKNWPMENWIRLGNHFLKSASGSLVIVSGEADAPQRQKLQALWQSPRVRFAESRPLPELAALLENAIFVGHDSGISHLAAAAGASCLLLFGPTDPAIWAPLNTNACVIRAPGEDFAQLEVDLVRAALDQALVSLAQTRSNKGY